MMSASARRPVWGREICYGHARGDCPHDLRVLGALRDAAGRLRATDICLRCTGYTRFISAADLRAADIDIKKLPTGEKLPDGSWKVTLPRNGRHELLTRVSSSGRT